MLLFHPISLSFRLSPESADLPITKLRFFERLLFELTPFRALYLSLACLLYSICTVLTCSWNYWFTGCCLKTLNFFFLSRILTEEPFIELLRDFTESKMSVWEVYYFYSFLFKLSSNFTLGLLDFLMSLLPPVISNLSIISSYERDL